MNVEQAVSAANRDPPAASGDSNPNAQAALRVAGTNVKNPPILTDVDYLDYEESLRLALHGADTLFGEANPQTEDATAGAHTNHIETSPTTKICRDG